MPENPNYILRNTYIKYDFRLRHNSNLREKRADELLGHGGIEITDISESFIYRFCSKTKEHTKSSVDHLLLG